jgi:fatty acid desaturase
MNALRKIIHSFFLVVAGSTIGTAIFMTIFLPKLYFTVEVIWQVIVMSAISSGGSIIFHSMHEISKTQMKLRVIIHYAYINAAVLGCAFLWGWVDAGRISQVITMILLIASVYFSVTTVMFNNERKIAEDMNQKLRKVYPEEDEN